MGYSYFFFHRDTDSDGFVKIASVGVVELMQIIDIPVANSGLSPMMAVILLHNRLARESFIKARYQS